MGCEATDSRDLEELSEGSVCEPEYRELGPGHIISPEGDEYIKIRGFEDEPGLYLWSEVVSIEDDTWYVRALTSSPEDSEFELERGEILICEKDGPTFVYKGKP